VVEGQYTSFPTAFNSGRKYFAPPPTSVASERLFSTAGEKRNHLAPEQAEALMLENFSLVGGNYQY